MVMKSSEAAQGWCQPVRLLWIDGDHNYEAVKEDFLLWEPHVIEGGVIALHDTYTWEGPRKVVEENILRSDRFSILGLVDSITAVKKIQRIPTRSKIKRKFLLLTCYLYILGRQHTLPGEIRKWAKRTMKMLSSAN